jgi:two-component sensor histidine kinase
MDPNSDGGHRWVLPFHPRAAAIARRHVESVCSDAAPETVETAQLLVTELIANAVQHGAGVVVLTIQSYDSTVRVGVEDGSRDPPVVGAASPWAERGIGMQLVVAQSSSFGVDPRDDGQPGKRVWFTLPRAAASEGAAGQGGVPA